MSLHLLPSFLPGLDLGPTTAKRTMYVACKLSGATLEKLAATHQLICKLNEPFQVLPFAFDFQTNTPLGDPLDVLRHDFHKVETAAVMVVILNGDVSDGRGMEIAHRMHQSSDQVARTLILAANGMSYTPMYLGFKELFGVETLSFDELGDIPAIVTAWYERISGETLSQASDATPVAA